MISRRGMTGCMVAIMVAHRGRAASAAIDPDADLQAQLVRIEAASSGGRLGVAVLDTANGRDAGYRADERFPMESTFKVLAVGAVLQRVDRGQDDLLRRVRFTQSDVLHYAPATRKRVGGDGMSIADLCAAAITLSDNTAANLLLHVIGGPPGLTAFARSLGDTVTRLDRIEPTLNTVPGDPRDTTTPHAMLADLKVLTRGSVLSPGSRDTLLRWMSGTRTGDATLRAKLPLGWRVADKTGSGGHGTNNDVGLLYRPDGGRQAGGRQASGEPVGGAPIMVAAYLTGSTADLRGRQAALADVGAAVARWSQGSGSQGSGSQGSQGPSSGG
jgi:beta-lactamase class A